MEHGKINICRRLDGRCGAMAHRKRLRVSEVNPHLICVLCGGYYIDATTIIECMHTFCKTCIVGYLEASKHCPVCDNLVHKTKPHLRLRPDHTLQDIVYKLVPGLFQDEMRKRRDFYKEEIETGRVGEHGIPEERERIVYSADEQFSLVLELSSDGNPPLHVGGRSSKHLRLEAADRRYLLCPGNFSVGHLKKFIRMKFNLHDKYQVEFFHTDEGLLDHYTLVDIAYIYSWRRKGPLRLYYSVFTNPAKRFKPDPDDVIEPVTMDTETIDVTNTSDLKTETSGYFSDEEKLHDSLDKSVLNTSDESKADSVLDGDGMDIDNDDIVLESTDKLSAKAEKEKLEFKSKFPETEGKGETKLEKCETTNDDKPVEKCKPVNEPVQEQSIEELKVSSHKLSMEFEDDDSCSEHELCIAESENSTSEFDSQEDVQTCFKSYDIFDKKPITENNQVSDSSVSNTKEKKTDTKEATAKCEKVKEKPEMVEASTDTVPCTSDDKVMTSVPARLETKSKCCYTNQDISEPVVSSTQNTQGCQTEPPDQDIDTLDIPHSSESDMNRPLSPGHKHKVDVSCETDNLVVDRQKRSKDNVTVYVSTDTEANTSEKKRRLVDSATDIYDFPKSEMETHKKSKYSSKFSHLSNDISKRKLLSVDCSVGELQTSSSNKRKSVDTDLYSTETKTRKPESKTTKRSVSYSGQINAQKTAYSAQPLSPTKITVKFTQQPKSPKSPSKSTCPKSPSRSETTGFQSQYQSFVMELPEKTYRFEGEDQPPVSVLSRPLKVYPGASSKSSGTSNGASSKSIGTSTATSSKSSGTFTGASKSCGTFTGTSKSSSETLTVNIPQSQALPSSQKKSQKSAKPRGRPPKVKGEGSLEPPLPKEKKHKSRSHSPKRKVNIDSAKSDNTFILQKLNKCSPKYSTDSQKVNKAYSWINKIDNASGLKSNVTSDSKPKDKKGSEVEQPPPDLRIPKQILYFSNGQYTLTTVSNVNALKQSSPISPPPKTVFTSEVLQKEQDRLSSKSKDDKDALKDSNENTNTTKDEPMMPELRLMDVKVTEKLDDLKIDKLKTETAECDLKVIPTTVQLDTIQIDIPTDMSQVKSDTNVTKDCTKPREEVKTKQVSPKSQVSQTPSTNVLQMDLTKQQISPTSSNQTSPKSQISPRTDANDNKITKALATSSGDHYVPNSSAFATSPSAASMSSTSSMQEAKESKAKKPSTADVKKPMASSPAPPLPEYRHQSPFFTSLSGAKLGNHHRHTTHLNIPNLASHFSGAHHLYQQGRFTDRLGAPLYGSFSMNDKSVSATIASKLEEARRLEAQALSAHCSFMTPFPDPYLRLMHSHLVSSLPPPPHLTHKSSYAESSKSLSFSDHATHGASSMSQIAARQSTKPANTNSSKGKGKNIDNVISAITKMRTKKETQEQVNGIDLSTKTTRKEESVGVNAESNDKEMIDNKDEQTESVASKQAKVTHIGNGENSVN
ncbi:muscle M-line assembly protein unc-89-like isoform X1 [Mya arenaria]|nr:muscle M-line assembly protein unc-89-like isoform X1 [Mya arenaria]